MQQKRPHLNPLILALALAAVLMIWSVFTTSNTSSGATMSYSKVVHYFEHLQVTAFTLDRNTGVITMNIKEGDLPLPGATSDTQTSGTGGLMSGLLGSGSSSGDSVQQNDDGTVTVRYQLPYAAMFVNEVQGYIEAYDAANPDAPMEYDYTALRESVPWMEIFFYLAMLGCTGFILFSMLRGGAGGGNVMTWAAPRSRTSPPTRRPPPLPTWPARTRKKKSSKRWWSSSRALKNSTPWARASPTACCW